MTESDNELMRAAKAGDIRSFDAIVSRYADRIYAFTLRLSADPVAAEDASQETFIKAWKKKESFDDNRDLKAWLFAIARNSVFDIMRKRKDVSFSTLASPEDEEDIGTMAVDESIDIVGDIDRSIVSEAVQEIMKTLTPDQRAAVMLHDIEGMTFDEAGKVMNKPLNTVKSHYRRAILSLRKKLGGKDRREP